MKRVLTSFRSNSLHPAGAALWVWDSSQQVLATQGAVYALNYVHGTFYRDTDETPQNGRNMVDDFNGLGIEYADTEADQVTQSATQKQLNKYLENTFLQLNEEGQRVAIERVQELAQIPKYQRKEENDVDEAPAGDNLAPDDVSEADLEEKA